ncbi:MAG: hypothetical protein PHT40_03225 [Patescibacteria group bacterium]|nr:hypothetical protein [Patescibacteria group bacterium]
MGFEILEKKPKLKQREAPPDPRIDKEMYPWPDHLDDDERVVKNDPEKKERKAMVVDEIGDDGLIEDEIVEKIDAEKKSDKKEKKEKIDDNWIVKGKTAVFKDVREDKGIYEIVDVIGEESQVLLKNVFNGKEKWADFSQLKRGPEGWRAEEKKEKIIDNPEGKGILDKVRRIIGR